MSDDISIIQFIQINKTAINLTDLIPSLALISSVQCSSTGFFGRIDWLTDCIGRNDEWKKDHECNFHSLFIRFRLIKAKVSKLMCERSPAGGSRFYSGFFFLFFISLFIHCTFI